MQTLGLRLLEIVAAALLAGLMLLIYNGLTAGTWPPFMLFIVPLGFIWSMYLGVLAISNIAMVLFLVLAMLVVLAIYLIARFGRTRLIRIAATTVTFLVQQIALIVLFASLGVSS